MNGDIETCVSGSRSDTELHVANGSVKESTTLGGSSVVLILYTKVRYMKAYDTDGAQIQYLANVTGFGFKLEELYCSIHSWFQACVAVKRLSGECDIMDDMKSRPLLLTPYC